MYSFNSLPYTAGASAELSSVNFVPSSLQLAWSVRTENPLSYVSVCLLLQPETNNMARQKAETDQELQDL